MNFDLSMSKTIPYKIIAEAGAKKGIIQMTGFIYPWENNASRFAADFKNLEDSYGEIDILIMNLYGGSVFEGVPTYNIIKNSKAKTNTIVQGLAASMGSIIALAGNNNRLIAPMSRLMIHRAKTGIYGDHEDLAEAAEMVKEISEDLRDVYVQNSNKDRAWIDKNWMLRGKDVYLNVQKCLDYGLMTGTTDSVITEDVPAATLKSGMEAVAAYYERFINAQIESNSNTDQNEMKGLLLKFGLPENSTEQVLAEAIQKAQTDAVKAAVDAANAESQKVIDQLKAEKQAAEKQATKDKAEALVTAAIDAKKITPAQKESYMKLATADYDSTKAALDAMTGAPTIVNITGKGTEGTADGKDYDWYQKNDPDALAEMREKDPERFKILQAAYLKKK